MSRLSSIRQRLTPSRINVYFSILCFFSPPVLGSLVSFVFNGGGLASILLIASGKRRFNTDRAMMALTIAIYAYCAANLLASIANGSIVRDVRHLIPFVTFLFFPISYSTWSITPKTTLVRIIVLSSMAACFGALLLAIIQQYWLGMRAEGGAGNAIVFAEVLCLAVMVCMTAAVSGVEDGYRMALNGAALGGTVAAVYSGTRIIWLALLIAGIAVLLINQQRLRGGYLLRVLLLMAAVTVTIAVFGLQTISGRLEFLRTDWIALGAQGDYDTSLGIRVALWDIGFGAFREMPLFGHGVGATQLLIRQGFRDQFGMDAGFNHFHNGFLTALVQAGILGAATLAAIFVVAARNAALVLRDSADPIERFGATMIVIVLITYLTAGMTGILIGHDILDSVLMVFLVSGTYLASGRQAVLTQDQALVPVTQ